MTFTAAAERGNLEMVQWLHNQGCPWNEDACTAAVERDDFEMLEWLHIAGSPWDDGNRRAPAWRNQREMMWFHNASLGEYGTDVVE
jgi:hypothetical protein